MRLTNKVAIITGGGSGIGRGIAMAFAREGARIVIAGRDQKKLDAVAKEIGSACKPVSADVISSRDINRLVESTLLTFNRIHVLVNNAAQLFPGTAESHTEEEWDHTIDVNVRGLWLLARAVLPHLLAAGGGSIINIGSVLSSLGARNPLAYSASKGSLLA